MVAGKELLNFEDLQESCNHLVGGFITSITSKRSSNQKPLRIIDRFVFNNLVVVMYVNAMPVLGMTGN